MCEHKDLVNMMYKETSRIVKKGQPEKLLESKEDLDAQEGSWMGIIFHEEQAGEGKKEVALLYLCKICILILSCCMK